MNDFFISYQAFKEFRMIGIGEYIVCCSCGLGGIRQAVLEHFNANAKRYGDYEADNIVIMSLTVLGHLSAVQLASDTCNVIKIEDKLEERRKEVENAH